MTINRTALRTEAKKLYKKQMKEIPKKQRPSFVEFFKKYKNTKYEKSNVDDIEQEIDFDFDNIINVNEINDNDLVES